MERGFYRYPTICGDRVVFVCEDDLWSAPLGGGVATRLTASFAECTTPRLSPDGNTIAFVARDEGHPEVYAMPAQGGQPKRITFFGGTMASVCTWSADSAEIFFVCNHRQWYERETCGFAVPRDGGHARALGLGHMKSLSLGPHGGMVIGRNADDNARWKRYRGGTSGDLWIDRDGSGTFARLIQIDGNPVWPMWIGERIYFLADHEGIANLYSCTLDGTDLQRHTDEREYYARFPSTDGKHVVYTAGGDLRGFEIATGRTFTIEAETHSAAPQTVRRFVHASEEFEHFAPQPDGTGLAVIARGQPFTMPYWEEAAVHHGTGSAARYRLSEWMHDGERFAVVTDRSGFEAIEIYHRDAIEAPRALTKEPIGRITTLAASPVADVFAVANHRHELLLVDSDGSIRLIDKSLGNRIEDVAFSPDGRFIAYTWWPNTDVSIIRIAKVKSGKVHDVTTPLRIDSSPAWDPEGKYLFFISTRDFNPVYDALSFDLSFPAAMRPFVVTLRSDVPSPLVPKPRPVHRTDPHREEEDEKERPPVAVEIDFEGIGGRVLGLPVEEGHYGQIVAARHRVLFTRFEVRGIKPASRSWDEQELYGDLVAFDFEQLRQATVARDVA
ncbi:MAG: PD40 domain-containing protein, partial [Candidatus Eremiobacteraeota bacterium]|nr:PD40 domain-containing protein [Candidatus Eremiobacteraeota bacterium]